MSLGQRPAHMIGVTSPRGGKITSVLRASLLIVTWRVLATVEVLMIFFLCVKIDDSILVEG